MATHAKSKQNIRVDANRHAPITESLARDAINRVAAGETLTAAADKLDVARSALSHYIALHPDLDDAYRLARQSRADVIADDIIKIADAQGDPHDKRLRIDTRKWLTSKLYPRAYGDSIAATVDAGPATLDAISAILAAIRATAPLIDSPQPRAGESYHAYARDESAGGE